MIRPTNPFILFQKEEIEQSIVSRFEQTVRRYPLNTAVGGRTPLTYTELNLTANKIANALLANLGEGNEPVAFIAEQGSPLVATILGILKAGKMYVPLDSRHPIARNEFTLDDSGARAIVTDSHNLNTAVTLQKRRILLNCDSLNGDQLSSNPALSIPPDSNAYIYYTSGSTGKPKGVFDIHRNVLHNVMRYTNNLHFSSEDRMTLLQSATFSGTVSSLFGALLNGATIFPYDLLKDGVGYSLSRWITANKITIYHSVPAIFRSFIAEDRIFPTVRLIRLEGDAASKTDFELYKKHFTSTCLLVNGLGATETGISRQFFMNHQTKLQGGIVPVGYPTEDMRGTILDASGKEVGVNVVGELIVHSKYLSPGYWKNDELTRKKFRGSSLGNRMYHTGDMCRMQSDGCLEYLGRKDFGVKIRGSRVEPVEVENALLSIENIKEAVVTTREDTPGSPHLVAYVVPTTETLPRLASVRAKLRHTLPDYMIPTRYVFLDALPLSPNGKVDRMGLPAPGQMPLQWDSEYVAPRTDLESQLVKLWEEVLKVQPIGVKDDFFDLGGDSLAAATMFVELERLTGKKSYVLSTLLENPTIEELTRMVLAGVSSSTSLVVPMQTKGTDPPFFCVHGHKGNVIGFRELALSLGETSPFYGLQSMSLLPDYPPSIHVEEMAQMFIKEVKQIQPSGPYFLGGFCFGGIVAFEMAHQFIGQGDDVRLVALLDSLPTDFEPLSNEAACKRIRDLMSKGRFEHHVRAMKGIGLSKKVSYVWERIKRKLGNQVWSLIARGFNFFRMPLPPWMRNVDLANKIASSLYRPKTYPGRVAIILPLEDRAFYSLHSESDWGSLSSAGVEVYFVPGRGGAMFDPPNVTMLASTIQRLIRDSFDNHRQAKAS